MEHWSKSSVFYHIYPLGLCGAPRNNDFSSPAVPRLEKLTAWLDHIQSLGVNAIYLGPVFESSSHGYDTVDYYWVDRRLGTNADLARFSTELHRRGMRLVLDAVFNHVGRDFWAFYDLRTHLSSSPYRDWFANLRFDRRSPHNDPFSYEGWNGHYSLVKLNLANPKVKEHLFGAVETWMREFAIDGLRLDAADCLDFGFMGELAAFCRQKRPDFWLMGEVIHGDYRRWANPGMLASVTNYECYKGLYSSHLECNYFELAYTLNRQFGPQGIYRDLPLYTFADNHDVNRVASLLNNPTQLYPLYALLFSVPGIPSIYYGSEWGLSGKKERYSDLPLRPDLDLNTMQRSAPQPALAPFISRLAAIRGASPALQHGSYRQLWVDRQQFAFAREAEGDSVIVAVNSDDKAARLQLSSLPGAGGVLVDLLQPADHYRQVGDSCAIELLPNSALILRSQSF